MPLTCPCSLGLDGLSRGATSTFNPLYRRTTLFYITRESKSARGPIQTPTCRGLMTCNAAAAVEEQTDFTWKGSDEFSGLQDRLDLPPLPLPHIKASKRVKLNCNICSGVKCSESSKSPKRRLSPASAKRSSTHTAGGTSQAWTEHLECRGQNTGQHGLCCADAQGRSTSRDHPADGEHPTVRKDDVPLSCLRLEEDVRACLCVCSWKTINLMSSSTAR